MCLLELIERRAEPTHAVPVSTLAEESDVTMVSRDDGVDASSKPLVRIAKFVLVPRCRSSRLIAHRVCEVESDDAVHFRRLLDEQVTETLVDHTVDFEVLVSGGDEEEVRMCANPLVRCDIEHHRVNTVVVAAFTDKLDRALCVASASRTRSLTSRRSSWCRTSGRSDWDISSPSVEGQSGNGDLSSAARPRQ